MALDDQDKELIARLIRDEIRAEIMKAKEDIAIAVKPSGLDIRTTGRPIDFGKLPTRADQCCNGCD